MGRKDEESIFSEKKNNLIAIFLWIFSGIYDLILTNFGGKQLIIIIFFFNKKANPKRCFKNEMV